MGGLRTSFSSLKTVTLPTLIVIKLCLDQWINAVVTVVSPPRMLCPQNACASDSERIVPVCVTVR